MNIVVMTQKKRDTNGITSKVQDIAKLEGIPSRRIISGKSFNRLLEIAGNVKEGSRPTQETPKERHYRPLSVGHHPGRKSFRTDQHSF